MDMKKILSVRLDENEVEYIDHLARLTNTSRTTALRTLIDLVQGSFMDEDVVRHGKAAKLRDFRKGKWEREQDDTGKWTRTHD